MTACKALALDLDGTLLNETGEIEPRVAAAVERACAAGVAVFLFSGRMHPAIEPHWNTLALDTPIVSYNGGKIQLPGQAPLSEKRLGVTVARAIIDYCRRTDLHVNAYFEDKLYVFRDNELARWYADYFKVALHLLDEDEAWPEESPAKLLCIAKTPEEVPALFEPMHARFRREASLTTSSSRFIELLPPRTSKGEALKDLGARLGIPPAAWVAVGDGMNDRQMLQTAGAGLAVENGSPELREYADAVVPPLYRGGIEHVLREYFRIDLPDATGHSADGREVSC